MMMDGSRLGCILNQFRTTFFRPSGSRNWLRGSLDRLLEQRWLLGHAAKEQVSHKRIARKLDDNWFLKAPPSIWDLWWLVTQIDFRLGLHSLWQSPSNGLDLLEVWRRPPLIWGLGLRRLGRLCTL